MKRVGRLRHSRKQGCYLKREGASGSLSSSRGKKLVEAVPRNVQIPKLLARKICRRRPVPPVGGGIEQQDRE